MKGELPFCNKLIYRREFQRANNLMSKKITGMKFSNFSALKGQEQLEHPNRIKSLDIKLSHNGSKNKVAKTNLNNVQIRHQNKLLYNRLVHSKSKLSRNTLAVQRSKAIEHLNRIRKYPSSHGQTVKTQMSAKYDSQRQYPMNTYSKGMSANLQQSTITSSMIDLKRNSIAFKISQQDRQQRSILLWSKVIQLNKNIVLIKIIRLKTSYSIQVKPHSLPYMYHISLPQQLATELLTQNDYDYEYICRQCIKISQKRQMFEFVTQGNRYEFKFLYVNLDYSESKQQRLSIQKARQNSMRSKQEVSMISVIKHKDQTCIIEDTDQQGVDDDKILDSINIGNIFIDRQNK